MVKKKDALVSINIKNLFQTTNFLKLAYIKYILLTLLLKMYQISPLNQFENGIGSHLWIVIESKIDVTISIICCCSTLAWSNAILAKQSQPTDVKTADFCFAKHYQL